MTTHPSKNKTKTLYGKEAAETASSPKCPVISVNSYLSTRSWKVFHVKDSCINDLENTGHVQDLACTCSNTRVYIQLRCQLESELL